MASSGEEEIREALAEVLNLYDIQINQAPKSEVKGETRADYSDHHQSNARKVGRSQ